MKILVIVDPGDNSDFEKIVAEVDENNLHDAIAQINKNGIHDRLSGIWYPPHQVMRIEYEPAS